MESYVRSEEARELFGDDFFGCDTVARMLGDDDLFGPAVPQHVRQTALRVPFSRDELRRAKSLGMALIFRISRDKYGDGLTIRYLRDLAAQSFCPAESRFLSIFGDRRETPWYASEAFARSEVPRAGWSLVSKRVIPQSIGQAWKDQRDTLRQWAEENFSQAWVVERRTAVEAVYDSLLFWSHNHRLETNIVYEWHHRQCETNMVYDWTATISSRGWPVFVGYHDSRLWIDAVPVRAQDPCVGVCPTVLGLRDRETSRLIA